MKIYKETYEQCKIMDENITWEKRQSCKMCKKNKADHMRKARGKS